MDIKTLAYMGQRVDKARSLNKRIEELKGRTKEVQGKAFQCISLRIGSDSRSITEWGKKATSNDYLAEMEACMLNVYIDSTNAEISRLEKELAEL